MGWKKTSDWRKVKGKPAGSCPKGAREVQTGSRESWCLQKVGYGAGRRSCKGETSAWWDGDDLSSVTPWGQHHPQCLNEEFPAHKIRNQPSLGLAELLAGRCHCWQHGCPAAGAGVLLSRGMPSHKKEQLIQDVDKTAPEPAGNPAE